MAGLGATLRSRSTAVSGPGLSSIVEIESAGRRGEDGANTERVDASCCFAAGDGEVSVQLGIGGSVFRRFEVRGVAGLSERARRESSERLSGRSGDGVPLRDIER